MLINIKSNYKKYLKNSLFTSLAALTLLNIPVKASGKSYKSYSTTPWSVEWSNRK